LLHLNDEAARLENLIPAERWDSFRGHLRTQIALHLHSNEMTGDHSRAMLALADGNKDEALAEMKASLAAAEVSPALPRPAPRLDFSRFLY